MKYTDINSRGKSKIVFPCTISHFPNSISTLELIQVTVYQHIIFLTFKISFDDFTFT